MITGACIPYVQLPTWRVDLPVLGTQTIGVFGPLVVAGIIVGYRLSQRYARVRGLDPFSVDALATAAVVVGLVVAHWYSLLLYYPHRVIEDPWALLPLGGGLSSVGGFAGGVTGYLWGFRRRRLAALPYADALAFGLLAGFTIGRLGCALVHDHPGAILGPDVPWAVGPWPDGNFRYDLGLVELTALLLLCAFTYFKFDWRHARPGSLTAWISVVYGTGRFWLDFLRAADARYAGLTPAQYACLAIVLAGLVLEWLARNRARG